MKRPFVYTALALGLGLSLLVLVGAKIGAIPRIFLLIANEVGFVLSLLGAASGWRLLKSDRSNGRLSFALILCACMALGFMVAGFVMWPSSLSLN